MSDTPTQAIGTIHLHKQGHVGTIVFDNQAKFNAMNYDMWVGLPRHIQDCIDDHEIRLIVLTGAGEKAFVSGADISQFGERRSGGDAAEDGGAIDRRVHGQVLHVLEDLRRKFPRRRDDEGPSLAARTVHQAVQDGQHEGGGLAAACRCARQQVATGQCRRNRIALDGGRTHETEFLGRTDEARVQVQISKSDGHQRS